jgi:phosphoribosylaminoimidazole-succinocarboxamide synthase
MNKGKKLYEGKAKIIYEGPEKGTAIQHFKDDATAFNNQKKSTVEGKGVLNNRISEHILNNLNQIGIKTHLIKRLNMREQLVKLVNIYPVEFIVRNIATGSLTKRLGIADGTVLSRPLVEYSYKNDELGDPLVAKEHILEFKWVPSENHLNLINSYCLRINDFMQGMFRGVGIKLVDFKLEFGTVETDGKNEILLADEISPDTCRLWDVVSERKLDKDRFRKDLGNIIQAYQEVARRLGIIHEEANISEVKFGKPKAVNLKNK